MQLRKAAHAAGLVVALLWPLLAEAAPRLRLGRPGLTADGIVAVPVLLRARRRDRVAALNFTLRVRRRPGLGALVKVAPGPALGRAGARLAASIAPWASAVSVLVVPRFGVPLQVLRRGRVATVYLRLDGRHGSGTRIPIRAVRRGLLLEDVVFSDTAARVLRPARRGRHRRGRKRR